MAGMKQSLMVDIQEAIGSIINQDSLVDTHRALHYLLKRLKQTANRTKQENKNKRNSFNALLREEVEEKISEFFPNLKKLLSGRDTNLANYSVILFGNFVSLSTRIQDAIRECGAIEILLELLFSRDHQHSHIEIIKALSKIANESEKNQARILYSGRVADLVQLMRNEQLRDYAADAIASICKDNDDSQKAFAEAGAIPTLVELLAANPAAGQNITANWLIQALGVIVEENPENQRTARLAGCIPQILQLMTDAGSELVRAATAKTLERLFYGCLENMADVLEHGGVDALSGLLKDESVKVRTKSSCALKRLFENNPAALVAFREGKKERTMETLCQLLLREKDSVVLCNVLAALCDLAEGGQSLHGVLGRLRDLEQDDDIEIRNLAARAISFSEQQQQRDNEPASSAFLEDIDMPPPQPRQRKRPVQAATSKGTHTDLMAKKARFDTSVVSERVEMQHDPLDDNYVFNGESSGGSVEIGQALPPVPTVSPTLYSSDSHSSGSGDGVKNGFEWLQASLTEHEYGLFPPEKLLPVIKLLRDEDIFSAKCFLLISSTSLDDLLGRLPLTEGLRTSIKGMHRDAQKLK